MVLRAMACTLTIQENWYAGLMDPSTSVSLASRELIEQIQVYVDLGKPDEEHASALKTISGEVSEKNVTIQELIVALGTYLTGDDEKRRGQATLLLVEVCNYLSAEPISISSNSIKHLAIFFRNRLSDFPSLLASMKGLEVIVTHHSDRVLPQEEFIRGITKSMSEVNVQSLSQSYRTVAYRVYMALLTNPAARNCLGARTKPDEGGISAVIACSEEEDRISFEFVDAVISAVDGERDPRALLVSLQLVSAVFKYHHRTVFTFPNKFFGIISSYFPITFTPPPDDPHGITSEDLIRQLEDCFCGHEALVDRLIPYMKHKLKNDIFHGKVQAMSCLARVCGEYGPSVFLRENPAELAETLFDLAQGSAGQNEEAAELANTAFRCIRSMVKDISMKYAATNDVQDDERESWNGLIEPLLRQTEAAMKSPESSITLNGKSAIQIACAVSSGSFIASKAVIERFLPLLTSHLPAAVVREKHLPWLPSTLVHIRLLLASLRTSGVNFSGMGTFHPVANHGPLLLRSLVSFLCREKYSMISEETVKLSGATCAVIREAAHCLKELITQLPSPDSLKVRQNEMLALISRVSDISIFGQEAFTGIHQKSSADLPALAVDDGVDIDDMTKATSRENQNITAECSDSKKDANYESGDLSDEHEGHNLVSRAHTEGDEDSVWSRRVMRQAELQNSGSSSSSSSSSSAADVANMLLKQSTLDILCQVSKTSSDKDTIITRVQEPVKELLYSTDNDDLEKIEQCVTILSSMANQCKFGKDDQTVFVSMVEPLISKLAGICDSSDDKNEILSQQIVTLLSGIKMSISNGNISAQKIKLLVTLPDLNFSTHVTNVLGSVDSTIMNETIILKYSELLHELVSQLSCELLEEFHNSILKSFYDKKVQDLALLDLISISIVLAELPKSSEYFNNEDNHLQRFVHRIADSPPEGISLPCLERCVIIVALFINKASWPLTDPIAEAALESCVSSLAKNFDQRDLALVLCRYLMLISRSILMRPDNSVVNFSSTACELIDSAGENKSMSLQKWHEFVNAILLQTMMSCIFRDSIAIGCEALTGDIDSVFISAKCNITILWKQKVWSSIFLELEKQLRGCDTNGEDVSHLLLVMNRIIHDMPNGIIANNKDIISTLCVRALSSHTVDKELHQCLQAVAIENVYKFIGDALNEKMKNHINTLAPACVHIAQTNPTAKMRCMALECLLQMSRLYSYHKLFSVKKLILKGLQKVVDDKKRAVRILAAKVRNEYSVLNTK